LTNVEVCTEHLSLALFKLNRIPTTTNSVHLKIITADVNTHDFDGSKT